MRIVVHDWLAELTRQSCQVDDVAGAQKLIALPRRDGHAALVAAQALGLEFPTRRGSQLAERHPEVVILSLGVGDGRRLVVVDHSYCHWRSPPSRRLTRRRNFSSLAFARARRTALPGHPRAAILHLSDSKI